MPILLDSKEARSVACCSSFSVKNFKIVIQLASNSPQQERNNNIGVRTDSGPLPEHSLSY